ncbi:hypothetical protein Bequi_13900 [Brachybacterium sp. JHP9]|uniref:Uncharacterized protein n=1 Tax=Brachybacterium equifaecis TaxID=2910770 RepID=A0ABT0R5D0_9MICO|nr:hypothetical protein [Brachybacterium equifaecis]MCL6424459.1 hypothetical protein [Brachybacterium equifaecis]
MTNNDQAQSLAASIAPADLPEGAFTELTRTPLMRASLHTTEDGECLVRARFTVGTGAEAPGFSRGRKRPNGIAVP